MIAKVLESGYNSNTSFPASAIIPAFSKGLDKQALHKQASIFEQDYDKFERKPGYTYIHLISVADGDQYGPNSRADFYNGEPHEIVFPHPEKGVCPTRMLDGGISKYHNKMFMTNGGVYTEHKSGHDGMPSQGYIVAAKVNPDMYRGELLIGVKTDLWAPDIERLSNGIPMKFSIGCDTPYDICSICGHEAHSEAGHCDHYKNHRGEIMDDGHQVYVITDKQLYHDISRVKSPAEKIAFSIKKVASADYQDYGAISVNPKSVPYMLKTAHSIERYNTLQKLAKLEKEIEAMTSSNALDKHIIDFFQKKKASCCSDSLDKLHKFLDYAHDNEVLGCMADNKCVLSSDDFIDLFIGDDKARYLDIDRDEVRSMLPGIFTRLSESNDLDSVCCDESFKPAPCRDMNIIAIVHKMKPHRRVAEPLDIINNIVGDISPVELISPKRTIIVKINRPSASVNSAVADEYASYLLSAMSKFSPDELAMTLLEQLS